MASPNPRKAIIWTLVAVAALAALVVFARHSPEWRNFSWEAFWTATRGARPGMVLAGIALIFGTYLLRTWRWKVLMTPQGRFWPVFKGTVVGFTGMAFLGRPGDLVRPYYIARKHGSEISSQMAVWLLERVFDMAAVVLLVGLDLAFDPKIHALTKSGGYEAAFRRGGLILSAGMVGILLLLVLFHWNAPRILRWLRHRCETRPAAWRRKFLFFVETLAEGTCGLKRVPTLIVAVGCSVLVWLSVAACLWVVVLAYPDMLPGFSASEAILLMGLTACGSVVQLPGIGGGFQLVTLGGLTKLFGADAASASSAALLVWLICFYAIAPIGAAIATHEGISLRGLEQTALAAEVAEIET